MLKAQAVSNPVYARELLEKVIVCDFESVALFFARIGKIPEAMHAWRRAGYADRIISLAESHGCIEAMVENLLALQNVDATLPLLLEDHKLREEFLKALKAVIKEKGSVLASESISFAIRLVMQASLPLEIIQVVKLVLGVSEFATNKNLQNLLLLTLLKQNMFIELREWAQKLKNYDGNELGKVAESYDIESAIILYKNCNENVRAVELILQGKDGLALAKEFASIVKSKEVYLTVAQALSQAGLSNEAQELESFASNCK